MTFWCNHPRSGKPDAMLSVAVYAVAVVLIKFLLSDVSIGSISFGDLDAGVIGAILTPTFGAYAIRKYSDSPDKKHKATEGTSNEV